MKKVLSVLVAALMLAALCVPAFAAGEAVTLKADKTEAAIGDTVTITVDVTKLSGLEAVVKYDTAAFDLVEAVSGDKMTTVCNTGVAGEVKLAGAAATVVDGAAAKITLKYKGGEGVVSIDIQDAVDADDASIALTAASVKVTEKAEPTTEKVTEATKTDAETTKTPDATKTTAKVKNPTTGGSVSVAASAAAVVVMAAAVAYTMKKKNED